MSEKILIELPLLLIDCPKYWKNFGKSVFGFPETCENIELDDLNRELALYNAVYIDEGDAADAYLEFENEASFIWFKLKYDHG